MEFMAFNDTRRIHQLAPIWNLLGPAFPASPMAFPGKESTVVATLHARYESFENTTVTLFDLDFRGEYLLLHPGPKDLPFEIFFPFPANLQTLHEVTFRIDGEEPADVSYALDGIRWSGLLESGRQRRIVVGYKADGATAFTYALQHGARSDVDVKIVIDGLSGSRVSSGSLAASSVETAGGSEVFAWKYKGLIPDRDIQVLLPTTRDLAHRLLQLQGDFRNLSIAAPFLVALYVLSLVGILRLTEVRAKAEAPLLAGLAAAMYFPVLTFLAAVLPLVAAFGVAFSVITGLVLAFLRAMAGNRRTLAAVAVTSVACLGMLSFGLLTPWRGLSASLGGIILVGTFMVLLAKHRAASPSEHTGSGPTGDESQPGEAPEPALIPHAPRVVDMQPSLLHCPDCGHALDAGFDYCPGCGRDARRIRRCQACGYAQVITAESPAPFCLNCGTAFDAVRDKAKRA
jgi:hypothetical protein